MSKNNFKNLLKTKVRNNAFQYLIDKQRSKGSEIEYSELKMADYLLPYNRSISIDQKRQIFSIRNRMINIPANFQKGQGNRKCICGENEIMKHIYNCKLLNRKEIRTNEPYENIFNGNIEQQNEVMEIFEENLRKLEKIRENKVITFCGWI